MGCPPNGEIFNTAGYTCTYSGICHKDVRAIVQRVVHVQVMQIKQVEYNENQTYLLLFLLCMKKANIRTMISSKRSMNPMPSPISNPFLEKKIEIQISGK